MPLFATGWPSSRLAPCWQSCAGGPALALPYTALCTERHPRALRDAACNTSSASSGRDWNQKSSTHSHALTHTQLTHDRDHRVARPGIAGVASRRSMGCLPPGRKVGNPSCAPLRRCAASPGSALWRDGVLSCTALHGVHIRVMLLVSPRLESSLDGGLHVACCCSCGTMARPAREGEGVSVSVVKTRGDRNAASEASPKCNRAVR